MRGDLVSRPIGEVMQEAREPGQGRRQGIAGHLSGHQRLWRGLKYRTGFWGGRPVKTRLTDLARALGELGVWVRLHYVYPYPTWTKWCR